MIDLFEVENWWLRLSDERKLQIYQWLERPKTNDRPIPGQIFLITEEGEV